MKRDFITVTLTCGQWADLERLLDRGHDDLSHYLENGDPKEDGFDPEEVAELDRLSQGVATTDLTRQLVAARYKSPWSDDDAAVASKEGWNLFRAEGSELTASFWDIEREEDQEPAVFRDDTEALKHVYDKASAGSELHRRALALHMTIAD